MLSPVHRYCISAALSLVLCCATSTTRAETAAPNTPELPGLQLMGAPALSTYPAPHRRQTAALLPNDPLSAQQWSFMSTEQYPGAADIFNVEHNSQLAEVVVAIVDSGLRLDHEDYTTLPGYDFISDIVVANDGDGRDSDASDPGDWVNSADLEGALSNTCKITSSKWHGTAIAGVIGAEVENQLGIAGAARNVKLLPVRVTGKCGGYVRDLIDGIRWAAGLPVSGVPGNATPARVINLSVGFAGNCSNALQGAINDATNAGAILVTAATNYAVNLDDSPHAPASCDNVLTIGANLRNGALADYSAIGSQLFMLGPGGSDRDGIISTDNTGTQSPDTDSGYGYHYGTSLAAAHVSATLATLLSATPGLDNTQLRTILQRSAIAVNDQRCEDDQCGAGILNTQRAVKTLMDGEIPPVNPAALPPATAAAESATDGQSHIGAVSLPLVLLGLMGCFSHRVRLRRNQ